MWKATITEVIEGDSGVATVVATFISDDARVFDKSYAMDSKDTQAELVKQIKKDLDAMEVFEPVKNQFKAMIGTDVMPSAKP